MKTVKIVLWIAILAVCLSFLAGCRKKDAESADVAALQQQLAEAQAKIDTLESQQGQQGAADAQDSAELAELEEAYDAKVAELAELQTNYNTKAAELATLQTNYNAKAAELAELQTDYNAKAAELEALQATQSLDTAELQAAYAAKVAELTTLQAAYDAKEAELATQKAAYDAKVAELATLQAAYDAKVAELATLQAAYDAKVAELEEKDETIAQLQQELDAFPTIQGLYTFDLKGDGTYELAMASADITEAAIPARYKGVAVTQIGAGAFQDCKALTSVTIPDSVQIIEEYAFFGCTGLTSITIPNAVTTVGDSAFEGCTGLTAVHTTYLAGWCGISFGNRTANPLFYAQKLYLNDQLITQLTLPDGVTKVGAHTFQDYKILTGVTIPGSVTSIGEYAFSGCTGLTSIAVPSSVSGMGEGAFASCTNLTAVHITDLAKWCGISFANYNANPLFYAHNLYLNDALVTALTVPAGVKSIGPYVFMNYTRLVSLDVGAGLTYIDPLAFEGCTQLTAITFHGTQEQWQTLLAGADWCAALCSCTVSCTDGDVEALCDRGSFDIDDPSDPAY